MKKVIRSLLAFLIFNEPLYILWAGDVKSAVSYLESLSSSIIKNQNGWMNRSAIWNRKNTVWPIMSREQGLVCEIPATLWKKANDILVARRQKHNGMSWSKHGSSALAAIEMVYQNGYENLTFCRTKDEIQKLKDWNSSSPLNLCKHFTRALEDSNPRPFGP